MRTAVRANWRAVEAICVVAKRNCQRMVVRLPQCDRDKRDVKQQDQETLTSTQLGCNLGEGACLKTTEGQRDRASGLPRAGARRKESYSKARGYSGEDQSETACRHVYVRTVSTHLPGQPWHDWHDWHARAHSVEGAGARSHASSSLPLVSPKGELLPVPGLDLPGREASDLGSWLPGRVIEQAPLATFIV